MKTFQCEICGRTYNTALAANKCESRPVTQGKGVKVGDTIIITNGDGKGMEAQVESCFVLSMDWGHYAWERYWHTVGVTAKILESWGHRQLTFDSYEPL